MKANRSYVEGTSSSSSVANYSEAMEPAGRNARHTRLCLMSTRMDRIAIASVQHWTGYQMMRLPTVPHESVLAIFPSSSLFKQKAEVQTSMGTLHVMWLQTDKLPPLNYPYIWSNINDQTEEVKEAIKTATGRMPRTHRAVFDPVHKFHTWKCNSSNRWYRY